jgi:hypothetical protein
LSTNGNGTKSGFYRVNGGGALERVSTKLVAVAAVVGAFVTISGAVAAGVRFAQQLQRPVIVGVAEEVLAPYVVKNEAEHSRFLPRVDFDAHNAVHDAQDAGRDDEIREMRKNFEYIRGRLDLLADEQRRQR